MYALPGEPTHSDALSGLNVPTSLLFHRSFPPCGLVARVFSHNELLIRADRHRVWTEFTDVTKWPEWFVLTKDVTVVSAGKTIEQGTVLHLRIFGTSITTRLHPLEARCALQGSLGLAQA